MSIDKFFQSIDEKIEQSKMAEQNKDDTKKALADFMSSAIEKIGPMLQRYETELKKRDIPCELKIGEGSFSLNMSFKNGDNHDLTFGRDIQGGVDAYIFKNYYRSEKGEPVVATDAQSFFQKNWDVSEIEKRIRKHIEDYLFYEDRHK